MVETITRLNEALNQIIWGIPMMLLIVGVGLYLSLRLRFLQFRHFGHILKNTLGTAFRRSSGHAGAVSPFKAMCTALAASIAEEFGLLSSGGSDYHGQNKPHISMGSGKGCLQVPCRCLSSLKGLSFSAKKAE